jgi:hypothetical protein
MLDGNGETQTTNETLADILYKQSLEEIDPSKKAEDVDWEKFSALSQAIHFVDYGVYPEGYWGVFKGILFGKSCFGSLVLCQGRRIGML